MADTVHHDDFHTMELSDKLHTLRQRFGNSSDFIVRTLPYDETAPRAALVYIDGLVDSNAIGRVIEAVERELRASGEWCWPGGSEARPFTPEHEQPSHRILHHIPLPIGSLRHLEDISQIELSLLSGDAMLFERGVDTTLAINTSGGQQRQVEEPSTETVVRGPREGFTENVRTNLSLVRRKIKNPNLWTETFSIGKVSHTDVTLMYIHGLAPEQVLEEARARLKRIDIDAILESGYVEELIQDEPYSMFPTMTNSERPDVVAANLLEGRIAIFVDGSPFVLLAPVLFVQFFQAAEDYYNSFNFSIIRLLRVFSFFIALLAPALYIALTTFHQEAIPTPLLIGLAAQREGIPFPAFVEALIMEVTFEILREAGVRMPRAIGQAVSIVGALVLGDAAVQAGLVSPAMVIVVSLTAISSFVIPSYDLGIVTRVLRFLFMVLAASFGLFGISAGIVALVLHLCSLRSFGVPVMSPLAPMSKGVFRDGLFRFPLWRMHLRPRFLSPGNRVREHTPKPSKPLGRAGRPAQQQRDK